MLTGGIVSNKFITFGNQGRNLADTALHTDNTTADLQRLGRMKNCIQRLISLRFDGIAFTGAANGNLAG